MTDTFDFLVIGGGSSRVVCASLTPHLSAAAPTHTQNTRHARAQIKNEQHQVNQIGTPVHGLRELLTMPGQIAILRGGSSENYFRNAEDPVVRALAPRLVLYPGACLCVWGGGRCLCVVWLCVCVVV